MPHPTSEARLPVRVHPAAAANEVVGFSGEVLKLKVAAPPVRGKANKELCSFLGRILGIAPGRVSLIRGHRARNKLIAVSGMSLPEVKQRLSTYSET